MEQRTLWFVCGAVGLREEALPALERALSYPAGVRSGNGGNRDSVERGEKNPCTLLSALLCSSELRNGFHSPAVAIAVFINQLHEDFLPLGALADGGGVLLTDKDRRSLGVSATCGSAVFGSSTQNRNPLKFGELYIADKFMEFNCVEL